MADNPKTIHDFLKMVRKYGFEYFGLYYGNYRATIVNDKDPKKLGRVQVRIPQLASDNKVEYWAWPKGQPAGEDFGDFMIPPVGSPVWVEFENGNPQNPIWSGGQWAETYARVPTEAQRASPSNRVRKSLKWIFEMDDENDRVKISSKEGGHGLVIHGNGNIEVNGPGNFTKTTGPSSDTIDGSETVTVTGSTEKTITGSLTLAAAALAATITGTGTITIGGQVMTISGGSGSLKIEYGGSSIELTGSDVKIMGKSFLSHAHSGVSTGGGTTGGVV